MLQRRHPESLAPLSRASRPLVSQSAPKKWSTAAKRRDMAAPLLVTPALAGKTVHSSDAATASFSGPVAAARGTERRSGSTAPRHTKSGMDARLYARVTLRPPPKCVVASQSVQPSEACGRKTVTFTSRPSPADGVEIGAASTSGPKRYCCVALYAPGSSLA